MADSKKRKQVKRSQEPKPQPKAQWSPNPAITQGGNPNDVMRQFPVWKFSNCDTGADCEWSFHKDRLLHDFWNVIFPKLREYENMTWADIQVSAKKQNHYINTDSLIKLRGTVWHLFKLRLRTSSHCALAESSGFMASSLMASITFFGMTITTGITKPAFAAPG